MMKRLDGATLAKEIRAEVAAAVAALQLEHGITPRLDVVLVGEDPASHIYVRNKARAAEEVGIRSEVSRPEPDISPDRLREIIDTLNRDDEVDGILIQLPLPDIFDDGTVAALVDPAKDVDGLHPENVGHLVRNEPGLVPCTPAGILRLLDRNHIPIQGKRAVVIGRSNIVGKPTALLLLHRHATVTVCHSRTQDLPKVAAEADILIAAVGRAALVTDEFIKPGAAVIDVGIHRLEDKEEVRRIFSDHPGKMAAFERKGSVLVGDVDPVRAARVAGALSPVPGGVGPLTVAMLLANTLQAAKMRRLGETGSD